MNFLRLTRDQFDLLSSHLLKSDGRESVALALCGLSIFERRTIASVHEIFPIPDDACLLRSATAVRWPVEVAFPLFQKGLRRQMGFFKVHSHPNNYDRFSGDDDESDAAIFNFLQNVADVPVHYMSAFILPDRTLIVRKVTAEGRYEDVEQITVVGDIIEFKGRLEERNRSWEADDATLRTRQSFGEGTTNLLRNLMIGIVGCSGTGSWVCEMLARLGVGRLVLVDPDIVERKNLNRILNSTADDALEQRGKTTVMNRMIEQLGFDTNVSCFRSDLNDSKVIRALAECDVLFGCMDSADG